jgi:hypothetical protein
MIRNVMISPLQVTVALGEIGGEEMLQQVFGCRIDARRVLWLCRQDLLIKLELIVIIEWWITLK